MALSEPVASQGSSVEDRESLRWFDPCWAFLERRPMVVFALQAGLVTGCVLAIRMGWFAAAPAAIAVEGSAPVDARTAVEANRAPVRPFAHLDPDPVQALAPEDPSHTILQPRTDDPMWATPSAFPTLGVVAPRGGRSFSAMQAAAVERDHRKFLASLENYLNVALPVGLDDEKTKKPNTGDLLNGPVKPGVIATDNKELLSMSERVDYWILQAWVQAGVVPAPPATDDEFLRRLYLDLTGVIPMAAEARAFLDSREPDKRDQAIDKLLASTEHAEHLAEQWTNVLLPMDAQFDMNSGANLGRWLKMKLSKNVPYHRIVGELINPGPMGSGALYGARRGMPEELAADTARFLLGVQIQCAQCHNHPFDRWTVEDFKGYVAFFQDPSRFRDRSAPRPKFLGGDEVDAPSQSAARRALAEWIISRQNPYFARATVNRVWGMMFGRGLVDPIDDLNPNHPSSHPQLLDELSAWFVASGYDLRGLIRTLARTKAYQLSSQTPLDDPSDGALFASMAIKNLSIEAMIDCLAQAMNDRLAASASFRNRDEGLRAEFRERFGLLARGGTEYEGGIPQALWMMNGTVMNRLNNCMLVSAVSTNVRDDDERVNSLFLATLSRYPSPMETRKFVAFLAKRTVERGDRREAAADVLWALLNSAEFVMNH